MAAKGSAWAAEAGAGARGRVRGADGRSCPLHGAPAGACLSPESPAISGPQHRRPQAPGPTVSVRLQRVPKRPPGPSGIPPTKLPSSGKRFDRDKLGAFSVPKSNPPPPPR